MLARYRDWYEDHCYSLLTEDSETSGDKDERKSHQLIQCGFLTRRAMIKATGTVSYQQDETGLDHFPARD